jgi:hypothetical protein
MPRIDKMDTTQHSSPGVDGDGSQSARARAGLKKRQASDHEDTGRGGAGDLAWQQKAPASQSVSALHRSVVLPCPRPRGAPLC